MLHKKIISVLFSVLLVFSIFFVGVSSVAASLTDPVSPNPNPDTVRVVGRQMHIHVGGHQGAWWDVHRVATGERIAIGGPGVHTVHMRTDGLYRVRMGHGYGVYFDQQFRAASIMTSIAIPQFNITTVPVNVTIPQQNITHVSVNLTNMGRIALNRTVLTLTNILRLF